MAFYESEQLVAEEQAQLDFVGFVAKGILRLQKLQADGRLNVVGLLVENDMSGASSTGRSISPSLRPAIRRSASSLGRPSKRWPAIGPSWSD